MNNQRTRLVKEAAEKQTPFWRRVAEDLDMSSRRRRSVNLSRISRVSKEGETIVVPGKVLGDGEVTHKLTIVAQSYSQSALDKLKAAKCDVLTIEEFMAKHPKKTGRIIG